MKLAPIKLMGGINKIWFTWHGMCTAVVFIILERKWRLLYFWPLTKLLLIGHVVVLVHFFLQVFKQSFSTCNAGRPCSLKLCTGSTGFMLQQSLVRACPTCWSCCPSSTLTTTWLTFYTDTRSWFVFSSFLLCFFSPTNSPYRWKLRKCSQW